MSATFQLFLPYIFAVSASLCNLGMQVFVKMIATVMPTIHSIQVRSFLLLIFNTILIYKNAQYSGNKPIQTVQSSNQIAIEYNNLSIQQQEKEKIKYHQVEDKKYFSINFKNPEVFEAIIKRTAWATASSFLYLNSLQFNSLSVCNALSSTTPVMLFFIQAIFFKKPLKKMHFVFTLISFFGVLLIIRSSSSSSSALDVSPLYSICYKLMPLISAVAAGFSYIYLHELKDDCHELVAMEYNYISQILFNSLIMTCVSSQSWLTKLNLAHHYFEASIFSPLFIFTLAMMTIFAYGSNYFRVKALYRLQASKIAPFNYLGILLSVGVDFFIFNSTLNKQLILGILLASAGLLAKFFFSIMQKTKQSVK